MVQVEARTVLWYLTFVGFAVNYMIRINLNIAIVEMVAAKVKPPLLTAIAADIVEPSRIESTVISNFSSVTNNSEHKISRRWTTDSNNYSLERHVLNWTLDNNTDYEGNGFQWNEYQQGLILGSFFWAHWITQIPGGILAKKYGTKIIFGLSNVIGCWMCFFIPIVSYFDYRALIWLRVVQGLVTGLAWPSMHVLTASWIPPNERSKFVSAYLGSSVGIALFYPLFGYVMHWYSWEWVFHICGIIGTLWWLGWLFFVYNSPEEHPRISQSEVYYIQKSLGTSVQKATQGPTPWKYILTSRPVWMNVTAQWGGVWSLFTLMTQAPTYFRVIHSWNIRATGILSGLPHLVRMIFAYGFSMFADYLLRSEKLSRTNVRKLATVFCCIIHGFVVLALAYFGHSATAAIVFLTVAMMFHGAVASGPLASIVDIAPNYAGIVLGISGMVSVLPGFISPYIVGILTLDNQTYDAWKNVFLISATMLIGSGMLYVFFSDSNLQRWNNLEGKQDDKELQLLRDNSEKPAGVKSSEELHAPNTRS